MNLDDRWLDEALATARDAADAAAQVVKRYYRHDFAVEMKPDDTPVTVADREAEREIRRVLSARYPEHGFYGEEYGRERENAEFVWLIDPIDGTKSFVRGYPFFSTQIALMHRGELVVGVSGAAHFGETAWARRGGGAFLNGERIAVSLVDKVERATVSFGNIRTLAGDERWLRMAALVRHAHRTRGYGDFYHYHLLASGRIDAVIESDVGILDIAALAVIVREAGGVFTDLDGAPIGLNTSSVLATAPGMYDALRATFGD